MKYHLNRGFTLVELLVVISIIGLLASVVLASLSAARGRGQVGAGLTFAGQAYQALGVDAIGLWNFDEPSGTAKDLSGFGHDITIGSLTRSSNTPTNYGRSLSLNGDYAEASFAADTQEISDYTMTAWVNAASIGSGGSGVNDAYFVTAYLKNGANGIILGYGGQNNNYVCSDSNGMGDVSVVYFGQFSQNSWHHIACSFDARARKLYGYVDGHMIGSASAISSYNLGIINTVDIGQAFNSKAVTGLIDDVAIYTRSIPTAEIQKMYVEGLPTHSVAAGN